MEWCIYALLLVAFAALVGVTYALTEEVSQEWAREQARQREERAVFLATLPTHPQGREVWDLPTWRPAGR